MENKNDIVKEALLLSEKLGWCIIPVNRDKKSLIEWKKYQKIKATSEEITAWFTSYPDANIAVVTGKISNLVIVDIDPKNSGTDDAFKEVKTVKVATGGKGLHFYFQYEEGIKTSAGIQAGIDIRAEGGYAVLPPSLHKSGSRYEWLLSPHSNTPIIPLPDFVKEWIKNDTIKEGVTESNWNSEVLEGVGEGERNNTAASVAGKLLKRFKEEEWESEAWPLFQGWNLKNKPPLTRGELKITFESIKKKEKENREDESKNNNSSSALQLVEEIKKGSIVFFHTPHKEGFAAIKGDGSEIVKLHSKKFRQYLAFYAYKRTGKIVSGETIANVIQTLEGKALFEGLCYELFVRIARDEETICYDLGNGSAIIIDQNGWSITDTPPILFRRLPHQLAQEIPIQGGEVKTISEFINLKNDREHLLFMVFTVAAFIPDFPHPLLVLHGSQGASKTTVLRLLKMLIDPSVLKTLSAPDGQREFVQMASHHVFFFLDNLSSLPGWLSDSLARASTGDGFSKRELFSDDDDIIYSFQRTVGLNGINLVVEKADLLDRSILLGLERIPKQQRREEKEFWGKFQQVKSSLLGAIFTAVAGALKYYPEISLSSYPRMADFTRWGCAISKALGYDQQDFLDAYYANISTQSEAAIDASPVGIALLSFMEGKVIWEGTATELLNLLEIEAEKLRINTKASQWPKEPSWLSRRIQVILPNLQEQGLRVIKDETSRPKKILLQTIEKNGDNADIQTSEGEAESDSPSPLSAMTAFSPTQREETTEEPF